MTHSQQWTIKTLATGTTRLLALTLVLTLAACQSIPGSKSPARLSEPGAQAEAAAGNHEDAARIYAELADSAIGNDVSRLRLAAVFSLLDAKNAKRAADELALVPAEDNSELTRDLKDLALAGISIIEGRTEEATERLDIVANLSMSNDARLRYQKYRALNLFELGDPALATSYLTRRELWLTSERDITENHQLIWDGLRQSDPVVINNARETSSDQTVAGWIDLVLSTNPVRNNERALQAAVIDWKRRYSSHAANATFVPALLGETQVEFGAPRQIALMLPLSGRGRGAATAIRDGFLAAHLTDAPAFNGPRIQIYDSSTDGAIVTYQRALTDGADLVVGPLTKSSVQEIALLGQLDAPLIALNRLPDGEYAPYGMIQFALAPEDEANAAAERAIAAGRRRAVALVPLGDWGDRVIASFRDRLEREGGRLLDFERFDPAETDFSQQISRVMQISASVGRRQRLRNLVAEPMQFEPRRRQDVDVIFLAARADNARAIKPQLRFHYSGDIPVYATSAAYTEDGRSNRDIRGIEFPEIPWLIAPEEAPMPAASEFQQYWRSEPQIQRLYAMGMDAYRLIDAVYVEKREGSTNGATGRLQLGTDGRVYRQLKWVRHDGEQLVRQPDLELATEYGTAPQWQRTEAIDNR